jgi:3-deoxy-D-manno-octulosonic-acid transferase
MNLLDIAYSLAVAITAPIWARKARGDWRARFGHTPTFPPAERPRILLHAVSVGEVSTLRSLVPLLTPRAEVVISVGTDTGIARARDLFESEETPAEARARVVRYPLDFSRSVRRFLDAVKPTAVGLVELELWPNFIKECTRRSIPVAVINGRLSARSFRGYRRVRPFLRPTFARLQTAAVQDADYAKRFIEMGVRPDRVIITDTMKWDSVSVRAAVPGADQLAKEMGIDRARLLIVGGSTAEHEEALLHKSCPPGVQLLCAPRKPEHFEEAAATLPGCVRRSAIKAGAPAPAPGSTSRFLLDTIGELRMAYALADVVVMGRSFGTLYGSDPIEPIALGKPTVIGPRFSDFATVVQTLQKCAGIRVVSDEELPKILTDLLENPEHRSKLARNGQDCIRAHQGATKRHAELLLSLLPPLHASMPRASMPSPSSAPPP